MTNEEKAEEYTDSINTLIYDIEDNAINIARHLRKAFLDGLKEGRPKWHDLRKDPNDLPKENGHYWCYVDDGVFHTDYGVIYFAGGKWESEKWENKTKILTWCELPKFERQKMVTTKIKYNGRLVTVEVPKSYDSKDFSNNDCLDALFPVGKIVLCQKKPTVLGEWRKYKNKCVPSWLLKYYWIRIK